MKLQPLDCRHSISLWNPIYHLLFSIGSYLLFQTFMMHKKVHHLLSQEIFMGGLQVFLVLTWIWGRGEITFHTKI